MDAMIDDRDEHDLGITEDLAVFDRLTNVAGATVVDAGCGAGTFSRHLVARGARVIALEPDPEQAALNAVSLAGEPAIRFEAAGAECMPTGDATADGVVFSKSLHHVPPGRMDAALHEARRVLRHDGFLYVLEPEIDGTFSTLMRPFHDETEVRGAARAALARAAAPAFVKAETWRYRNVRRFADFEAFVRSVCGATYNAITRARVDRPEVRGLFEAGRCADGYAFEQPMRVDLFRGIRR